MRVLMLGWEYPPRISGGLGVACRGYVRALSQRGVDLCFVLPRAFGGEDGGRAEIRDLSAPVAPGLEALPTPAPREIAIASPLQPYLAPAAYAGLRASTPTPAPAPRLFAGGYGASLQAEVERYASAVVDCVRGERFDLIHAHDWMTWPAGLAARELLDRPLVSHVHSCEYDRSARHPDPHILAVEQGAFEAAERVLCVSNYTAEIVRTRYRCPDEKLRVVHNGADPVASAGPAPRPFPDPIVLFLGRLTEQKGPELFLEAARRVHALSPRVHFVFAGQGDLLPGLVERVAELGLERHVHFTGFLGASEVEHMLRLATVYVMPSLSEPFGLAPLEAAGQGTAVILSRRSGVAEVLKSALRVDPEDSEGLARRILFLLTRPELRQRLAEGAKRELARLTWERAAGRLLRLYRELAA